MKPDNIKPTNYKLQNVSTGRIFEDEGWSISDPEATKPSLIRAIYEKKQIEFKSSDYGIYKYSDWLPVKRMLKGSSPTITYKSKGLAKELGLENLYIAFSGYRPEIGATMKTCSFKETEAYSVCARLSVDSGKVLVVSSAGNTARAFAQVCSDNDIPLLLTVPYENIDALWFKEPLKECVKLICTPFGSDYFDAIALGDKACTLSDKFLAEGGAKNVARRDGMATTVLSAAEAIGTIPDCYFQAIGSGTGTIAAWESNLRLIEDGRFGKTKMKLFPSQNIPFTPMYDAWKAKSRDLLPMDDSQARKKALEIEAKVLSNRRPPYSIAGGVYDALFDSDGDMEVATNDDIDRYKSMFYRLEGIDIYSAAAVAVCSLKKSVDSGRIDKKSIVMLNITGGGEMRFKEENKVSMLEPSLVIGRDDEAKLDEIPKLFGI